MEILWSTATWRPPDITPVVPDSNYEAHNSQIQQFRKEYFRNQWPFTTVLAKYVPVLCKCSNYFW